MSETERRTYRERREAKAERLREWADKREAKATAALDQAHRMADVIPFGQPILVGHHSEGADRRYRARIAGAMDRGVEHGRQAADFERRADGIDSQLRSSIYSDDADAIEALQGRISGLEAERDRVKAYNASCRKGAPDLSTLDDAQRRLVGRLTGMRGCGLRDNGAFPAYHLSNLSGNIKRNRDRLGEIARARGESLVTDLIVCEVPTCPHEFRYVPEREFSGLCLDHADEASRAAHGWTPENAAD